MIDYDEFLDEELYGDIDEDDITTPEDELRERGMSLRDFL